VALSAVVGVPATTPGFAYVSSGTWSLVGVELDQPVLTDEARAANFTNEGGVDATTRLLTNITGLWVLSECVRQWQADDVPDSDLETVLAKKPDIIVSIPTDPVATASAYKAAAKTGAKLVFMDNVPEGMTAGKDYVSVVSADNYGNGVTSAHMMAKALGGKGTIGLIHHEADFFVTKQRYEGFKATIAKDYPKIKIVDDKGIAGPDFAGDAQKAADAMLTEHANLDGIWAVWDVPAEGVMAAARSAGRTDLLIATEDLGTNVAIALAKKQLVVGLGAQRPFDQGITEARLGAGSLIGKKAPAYVALSALPVEHDNVLQAWKQVYHADPPAQLMSSYKK